MSPAMHKLNNALFKAEHKSHYSKQDVDILDEYRTVVPVGMSQSVHDKVEQDKIKSNIYKYGNIIASYERTIKRSHNPKHETEQEYKNKIMSCTRDNQLFQAEIKELQNKIVPDNASCVGDLVEIDISKAFTFAFQQITEIQVFNEFDSFFQYIITKPSL